jgi:hypothetical protein
MSTSYAFTNIQFELIFPHKEQPQRSNMTIVDPLAYVYVVLDQDVYLCLAE